MPTDLENLIIEVRRTFQALRAAADELHRDLAVTSAMRAVMEHLSDGRPRTVPAMARDKNVSRQHIQQIVNALTEAGLADARPNARHRRSPLIALTSRGEALFAEIRRREALALAAIAADLGEVDLTTAVVALRALAGVAQSHVEKRRQHDE